ncbi:hypothetical protein ACWCQW_39410 [Streptomyces mirabilis]
MACSRLSVWPRAWRSFIHSSSPTQGIYSFTVSFSGRLLWIPLLATEAKPRASRKLARQRVVVRLEARHALETAALAARLTTAPTITKVHTGHVK